MNGNARDFDLVLFGATGFTGKLVAARLAAEPSLRWALAGRDLRKLEAVRATLASTHPEAATAPLIVVDARDPTALATLAARSKVVCTTVGPYAVYGSPLVAACVAAGTDYCDLTGEGLWVRDMIVAHHAEAQRTGARIVHCCGFDSVPSDLGVHLLQAEVRHRLGAAAQVIHGYVLDLKGGFSGGTVASGLAMNERLEREPQLRRVAADQNALCPGEPFLPDPAIHKRPGWDARARLVTSPFIMAVINTRIVRRSHFLATGSDPAFAYTEVMGSPATARGAMYAATMSAGLAAMMTAMRTPWLRARLASRLPASGEGPSAPAQARGRFTLRLDAEIPGGDPISYTVSDTCDPGYASTAKMLSQAALALAFDDRISDGGILTPAIAMGATLPRRLRAAGLHLGTGSQVASI